MKTQDSQNVNDKAADVADTKDPNTVQLDTPIKRGDGHITSVTLRKPNSGELRGVSLAHTGYSAFNQGNRGVFTTGAHARVRV